MSGLGPEVLQRLQQSLVTGAGGYLRNPIREEFVTCSVCTTPVDGYRRCYPCNEHARSGLPLADLVAPLTYAVPGSQSGYVMHGYKAPQPLAEHLAVVALLAVTNVSGHARCAEVLLGAPITHWSTVPSLPAKAGPHRLPSIVSGIAPGAEVVLTAAATCTNPRALDASHFSAPALPSGSHVLLVEDTWAGGGHTQSAATALKAAGAERVSVIVIARWLRLEYGSNEQWARSRLTNDFSVEICPFTGGACP